MLPSRIAIKRERKRSRVEPVIARNATRQIIRRPVASPSKPSEKFTALANDTITKAAKKMYIIPSVISPNQ